MKPTIKKVTARRGTAAPSADPTTLLDDWRDQQWLRPLDVAFAAFVAELDERVPPSLILAAALVSRLQSLGHSCLPLHSLASDPQGILGWPSEAARAVTEVLDRLPADADAASAAWHDCTTDVLAIVPPDEKAISPLVLQDGRLYLRRYWRDEWRIVAQVVARTRPETEYPGSSFDRTAVRDLVTRLFAASPDEGTAIEAAASIDWQKVACAVALRSRMTIITGGPGTGKTYTAARLLVLLQALHASAQTTGAPPSGEHASPWSAQAPSQPLRVALAAPTGKAAARLRQSIDAALDVLRRQLGDSLPLDAWATEIGPARTLHALLGARPGTLRYAHSAANPLDVDVLIIDEASMVNLEMMATLLDALPATTRVVLLGDRDQLASVEAGAVMGDLCEGAILADDASAYLAVTTDWIEALTGQSVPAATKPPVHALAQHTVVLRGSRRFGGPIGRLATAVNAGDAEAAYDTLQAGPDGEVMVMETTDPRDITGLAIAGRGAARPGYRDYLERMKHRPAEDADFQSWAIDVLTRFDRCRVLCAVREGPWGVAGVNAGIERALVETGLLQSHGEWYEGRPVMITRNNPALGVFNGDIGLVLRPAGTARLRACFLDGATFRSISVGRLPDVETAFALTVHKSQGSEFDHVMLVLPDSDSAVLTRELVYTGITRARRALTLVMNDRERFDSACSRRTRRLSGLGELLRIR